MIKHRFVLRDIADFKVFAAIPCESKLLTWKKWVRPEDWTTLRELCSGAITALQHLADGWAAVAAVYGTEFIPGTRIVIKSIEGAQQRVETALDRVRGVLVGMYDFEPAIAAFCTFTQENTLSVEDDILRTVQKDKEERSEQLSILRAQKAAVKNEDAATRRWIAQECERHDKALALWDKILDHLKRLAACHQEYLALAKLAVALVSSEPASDLTCPVGLPFAYYTVELPDATINVVEGNAWVASRKSFEAERERAVESAKAAITKALADVSDETRRKALTTAADKVSTDTRKDPELVATEDERRVVEIITQMLTERSLNPQAPTKIPVRELDQAQAHQTREADKRKPGGWRTIKFSVAPPRYLREAAEHILTTPRAAHWVCGHWRNQPYGQGRTSRRQVWIAPHIRGLGEAGAFMAKVIAPRTHA